MLSQEASLSNNDVLFVSFPRSMEEVNSRILERKSSLKVSDDLSLASISSRIQLLRLALSGQSCSTNEIVQAQLGVLCNWPASVSVSILADIVFGLASCHDADRNSYKWDFDVIQRLVDFWLSLAADNGTCKFSFDEKCRLATYFGRLITATLSTKTVEATYLVTQLGQKGVDIIMERSVGAKLISNGLDDSHYLDAMREYDAVHRCLLESDPLHHASYFLDKFNDEEFLRSESWILGFFDQASKAMIVHPSLNAFAPKSLTSFGSAILSRAMGCFEDIKNVSRYMFTLCQKSNDCGDSLRLSNRENQWKMNIML